MQFFSRLALAASVLAATISAQSTTLYFTANPTNLTVGIPVTISYTSSSLTEDVTITLRKGDPDDLSTIGVLTSTATGGTYTWTPSSSLVPTGSVADDFALEITQGDQVNYSAEFSITGAAVSARTSTSKSSASTTASVTASSSSSAAISSSVAFHTTLTSIIASITYTNASSTSAPYPYPTNTTVLISYTTTANCSCSSNSSALPSAILSSSSTTTLAPYPLTIVTATASGTGYSAIRNATFVIPTLTSSTYSSSTSAVSTTTSSKVVASTSANAAGRLETGVGLLVGVAVAMVWLA